ncbi:MAG: hypothetical protein LBI30_03835 [Holosporales bacterium]|jgi:transaldolase|nr:hypothetical protein [Holosporales bacterium]
MLEVNSSKIALFADVVDEKAIERFATWPQIQGFTTNPSLLKKAGVSDYKNFAIKALRAADGKCVSFEVISDSEQDIEREAKTISGWGENVFVKIPFLKTDGTDNTRVIKRIAENGVKLNITAVFGVDQVKKIAECIDNTRASVIISIFAGRIADTGIDPRPIVVESKEIVKNLQDIKLLWASSREIFNVIDAQSCGCDIITLTSDLLEKFKLWGKDLNEYSRQTAEQFYKDAKAAQLMI